MSKSEYLSELVRYMAQLDFQKLKRHFNIAIRKHADNFGYFEDWHPIPRVVVGYMCGFLMLVTCFLFILPSAALWSIVVEKYKFDKTAFILFVLVLAAMVLFTWGFSSYRNIQFFEGGFKF